MENFVVSARKYRPATFRSVVGQGHITQTLQSAIERGTLAHAYLFTGPRGVGKTTCARIFAKAINCLNPTPDHEACGVCESCVAFDQGRSWGIHELDAASNNSVEDIRLLTEKVRVAPQVGRYSVYIIDEVHMLSTSAFNAFLKTLEEPPSYAIFILATTEKHKILPTILSRCQSYDFRRIRLEDIVSYLAYVAQSEGIKYDEESLNIIAQKADGGMRDALSTFDRVVSFSGGSEITFAQTAQSVGALDFNTYFRAVDLAWAEDYGPLLLLYDSVLESGFEGQIFIAGLADHFRNLLVARSEDTLSLLEATGSLLERYRNQASRLDVPFIMNAISLLSSCDGGYRNATNRRLHSELALMKLSGLKKKRV
ncbi:MAG: DNA polymerase III subunit gamma/tau [Mucinivorans sp.]